MSAVHYACRMSSLSVIDLFGVKGRVALVTGGCSGLGLMIAKVGRVEVPRDCERILTYNRAWCAMAQKCT